MVVTLHCSNLRFYAYHGLYEEEKKVGNEFELNISASFRTANSHIKDIKETINYAAIYELAQSEMLKPRELLETFLCELAQKIKATYPEIVKLRMSMYKLQMPLSHFQGRIGVEIEQDY